MADIDVVHRKSSSSWMWWILAAIVIIALVFLLTRNSDRGNRGTAPRSAPGSSMVTSTPTLAA